MNEKELLNFSKEFPLKIKIDNKNLIELSLYEDFPLWWLADFDFHIFIQFLSNNRIKTKSLAAFFGKFPSVFLLADLIYDLVIFIILRTWYLILKFKKKLKLGKKILIYTADRYWTQESPDKVSSKLDDFYDSIIQNLIDDKKIIITQTFDLNPIKSFFVFLERNKNEDLEYIPTNYYWSLSSWKKQYKSYKHFKKIKLMDNNNTSLISFLNYKNGKDFIKICDETNFIFKCLFPKFMKYINSDINCLNSINPDLIILSSEYGRRQRALLIASQQKKIPSIAIQHGIIHEYHKGYNYNNKQTTTDVIKENLKCPIPSVTAVYGEYQKDILIYHGSYPEESVIITGQPRYDKFIDRIKEKKDPSESNNIILLWACQLMDFSLIQNKENIESILYVVEQVPKLKVIIKPHPRDSEKDIRLLMNIIKNNKSVEIVSKYINFLTLIPRCDMVLIRTSTTGMESIALNKPLIVFDLIGDAKEYEYVREEVAFYANSRENLLEVVIRIINGARKDQQVINSYLSRHVGIIDGKATKRLVKEINLLLEKGD